MTMITIDRELPDASGTYPPDAWENQLSIPMAEAVDITSAMGVLEDGTAYLTLPRLAQFCGVEPFVLRSFVDNWRHERDTPRGRQIRECLTDLGHDAESLERQVEIEGVPTRIMVNEVCIALLEHFGHFETQGRNETATNNLRTLVTQGLGFTILNQLGVDPFNPIPVPMRSFRVRQLLARAIPHDYFVVFPEIALLAMDFVEPGDLIAEAKFDISVATAWSEYWEREGLEAIHGDRIRFPHQLPHWIPRQSEDSVFSWIYPIDGLTSFRGWLNRTFSQEEFAVSRREFR
jgi:hypothetical protein